VIGTTVIENASLLSEILNLSPTVFASLSVPSSPALSFSLFLSQKFQPSIPNLVYQYHLFANYASVLFSKPNPEIPE
jgi:hypothetical protein